MYYFKNIQLEKWICYFHIKMKISEIINYSYNFAKIFSSLKVILLFINYECVTNKYAFYVF